MGRKEGRKSGRRLRIDGTRARERATKREKKSEAISFFFFSLFSFLALSILSSARSAGASSLFLPHLTSLSQPQQCLRSPLPRLSQASSTSSPRACGPRGGHWATTSSARGPRRRARPCSAHARPRFASSPRPTSVRWESGMGWIGDRARGGEQTEMMQLELLLFRRRLARLFPSKTAPFPRPALSVFLSRFAPFLNFKS